VIPHIKSIPLALATPTCEADLLSIGTHVFEIIQGPTSTYFWDLPTRKMTTLERKGQALVWSFAKRETLDWEFNPCFSAYIAHLVDKQVDFQLGESVKCVKDRAKSEIRLVVPGGDPAHSLAALSEPIPLYCLPQMWTAEFFGSIIGTRYFKQQPLQFCNVLVNLSLGPEDAASLPKGKPGEVSEAEYQNSGFFQSVLQRISSVNGNPEHIMFLEYPTTADTSFENNLSVEGVHHMVHLLNTVRILQSFACFPIILFLPPPPFQGNPKGGNKALLDNLSELKRQWVELARRIRIMSRVLICNFYPVFVTSFAFSNQDWGIAPFKGGCEYLYGTRGGYTQRMCGRIKLRFMQIYNAVQPARINHQDYNFAKARFESLHNR